MTEHFSALESQSWVRKHLQIRVLFWHFVPFLRTHGGEKLSNNLICWQIIPFWDGKLEVSGTFFAHLYWALQKSSLLTK